MPTPSIEDILSPEGVAKIHSLVAGDEIELIHDELGYRLFCPQDVSVSGRFDGPGWYFRHPLEAPDQRMAFVMKVPDYRRDIGAAMGLLGVCMLTRRWLFSTSRPVGTISNTYLL